MNTAAPGSAAPQLVVRSNKTDVSYLPSWDAGRFYLNEQHRSALEDVIDIDGMLYPQDAMKLFELAWFSQGPVLEIGTYHGRSATIMAKGLSAGSNPTQIISFDLDATALEHARCNLQRHGVADRVTLVRGTSECFSWLIPDMRPGLVFVDGDHTYRGVARDLRALEPLVPNDSIVVLHDYQGYSSDDPFWIRVKEAAKSSWLDHDAQFIGRFGLCGVFRRRSGGPTPPTDSGPLLVHALSSNPAAEFARGIRNRLEVGARYRMYRLLQRFGRAGAS